MKEPHYARFMIAYVQAVLIQNSTIISLFIHKELFNLLMNISNQSCILSTTYYTNVVLGRIVFKSM